MTSRDQIRASALAHGWHRRSRGTIDTFARGAHPPDTAPSTAVVRVEEVRVMFAQSGTVREVRRNGRLTAEQNRGGALAALERGPAWDQVYS